MKPATLCEPTAASAIEAMHPHWLQSGSPPNWHGVMAVRRSAEMVCVTWEKIQSDGLAGGLAKWSTKRRGMASFG